MKKLSTFQIAILVIFGSLGAAGVLLFSLFASGANSNDIGNVTIWGTFPEDPIKLVLKDASDLDSRLSGVTYVQKDPTTFEKDLTEALASGRGPDLFFMRQDFAVHDGNKTLHIPFDQLSQSQFNSTFLNAAQPFIGIDGVVAVPILADPLVLYWNKDILATAGYSNPPDTWDQVSPMVKKLVKKDDAGTLVKSGIAMGEYRNIPSAKDILTALFFQAGGSLTTRDTEGVIRSALAGQNNLQAAVIALSFYTKFADPAQEAYSWSRALKDAKAMFAAGDLGLYIGHASDRAAIVEANPNLNFGISGLPQLKSSATKVNVATVYGLALARNTKNQQGSLTVTYLLAAEGIAQPLSQSLGMTSALRDVLEGTQTAVKKDPSSSGKALQALVKTASKSEQDLFNQQSAIAASWLDPNPEQTDSLFRSMIEDTVSGSAKLTEVVQRADKQIGEIIGL